MPNAQYHILSLQASPPEALCMANKVCTLIKNALEKENLERIGCKVTYYKRFPTIRGNAPMFFHKNESRPVVSVTVCIIGILLYCFLQ
jgi:hypothetical protein